MEEGLSPRGRGNRRSHDLDHVGSGSIPAWAGETPIDGHIVSGTVGLSPRGRGNRFQQGAEELISGSIPAWAGEPGPGTPGPFLLSVYPRVGGGTVVALFNSAQAVGLSPRGRGNRGHVAVLHGQQRSIPAWAGEPPPGSAPPIRFPVYPRVGGGTRQYRLPQLEGHGLSPRGRGNPNPTVPAAYTEGSIPAWAGEPDARLASWETLRVYPRVGGGTPIQPYRQPTRRGLSPRGRGNRGVQRGRLSGCRSIPAWAGEPLESGHTRHFCGVYPRVGGGTPHWSSSACLTRGSIPAWAGEPPC